MVFEHDFEEEIQADREESLKELQFLLEYEIYSSWWAKWVTWTWTQDWIEEYYAEMTKKKWRKYKLAKMFEDVKAQAKETKNSGSN